MRSTLIIGFSLAILALLGCNKNEDLSGKLSELQQQIDSLNTRPLISISTGNLYPAFDENISEYDVTSLNSLRPVSITVKAPSATPIVINGVDVKPNQPYSFIIPKLDRSSKIPITIGSRSYTLRTLPNDFPKWNVVSNNPTDGQIFFTPNTFSGNITSYAIITDKYGAPIFYKKAENGQMGDFKKHIVNGKIRYSYMISQNIPQLEVGYTTGAIELMNEDFKVIKSINLIPTQTILSTSYNVEGHDFIYIDDDHYIVPAYVGKIVYNIPQNQTGTRIVASVIQEIQNGKVIWEWDSSTHPEFYAESVNGNDFTNTTAKWADYAHFNSMHIDPSDGNLICSFRHLDEIVKISRKDASIIWKLGGRGDQFGLSPEQKFSHQHFARITTDNKLILFDNANATGGPSRILEVSIDEASHTLLSYKSFTLRNQFSIAMGSVQKQDSRYFIGWGARRPNEADISEVDFNTKQISFELFFQGSDIYSYRAYKF